MSLIALGKERTAKDMLNLPIGCKVTFDDWHTADSVAFTPGDYGPWSAWTEAP